MATRANVEAVLVKRLGGMLTVAELSIITTGANPDLADPIGWAVRKLGYTVADVTNVTSLEVAAVGEVDAMMDLAELRTMESILMNYSMVDSTVGPRTEKFDQLAKRLLELIPTKRKQIEREHDIDLGGFKHAGITMWRASDGVVYDTDS